MIIVVGGDGVDRRRGAGRRRRRARPRAMDRRPLRGRRERTESVVVVMRRGEWWRERSRGMVILD